MILFRYFVPALAIALFGVDALQSVYGDTNTENTLKAITRAATEICGVVQNTGQSENVDVTGDIKAQLSGLAKRLADLGVTGAGSFQSGSYANVLQKELATTMISLSECRLKVFDALQAKLLSSSNLTTKELNNKTKEINTTATRKNEKSELLPDHKRVLLYIFNADGIRYEIALKMLGYSSQIFQYYIDQLTDRKYLILRQVIDPNPDRIFPPSTKSDIPPPPPPPSLIWVLNLTAEGRAYVIERGLLGASQGRDYRSIQR